MNPIFIYQNEAKLDYNNKFTIDFIDNDYVNYIKFFQKNQYYISSLNCNITKANKKKVTFQGSQSVVDELSKTSRELLDKGAASKNDITYVTSFLTPNFNLPNLAPQKYKLVLNPEDINNNSYNYQFYDVNDKRLKFAKIYSPFSHFKNGFVFKGENDPNKDNKVLIQLVDNNSKIRCIFLQSINDKWKIGINLYRDFNAKFTRTRTRDGTYNWDSTNPNLIWEAEIYSRSVDVFNTDSFMKHLYYDKSYGLEENGKYPVIGKLLQAAFNDQTQAFIQRQLNVEVRRNRPFLIPGSFDNKRHKVNFASILDDCTYIGHYILTDHDKQQINKAYPNFSFNTLGEYVSHSRSTRNTHWEANDLVFFPSTSYRTGSSTVIFDPKTQFMKFISDNVKYKDYLDSNNEIFYYDSLKDLPGDLDDCEKLFDKDVLEIKKLVNDTGLLKEITEYEQLNLGLYDDNNIIEETFIQRFNKRIQLYGFISIPFVQNKKNHLITLKNLLSFRVKKDIQTEKLSFELAYLEKRDKILTSDQKIHNLSIVCVEKRNMGFIEKEIINEGLQSFDRYKKLNPIEIKITDPEIYNKLIFKENRRVKYRFIPNNILMSSSVQEETEVIFLIVNGLNDARDILLNGKLYKSIGCIYTNEIEGWDEIKKTTSNWVNCKFSNSKYPFGAKHLSFEFDTTSFHNLLDFKLNLLDQNGKEITFLTTEQKVPALNFTIQIIS